VRRAATTRKAGADRPARGRHRRGAAHLDPVDLLWAITCG